MGNYNYDEARRAQEVEADFQSRLLSYGLVTTPNIELTPTHAYSEDLLVFKVRDCGYLPQEWVPRDYEDAGFEQPVLTIVGWITRVGGGFTHISSVWHASNGHFGGGMAVPTSSIIECHELVVRGEEGART